VYIVLVYARAVFSPGITVCNIRDGMLGVRRVLSKYALTVLFLLQLLAYRNRCSYAFTCMWASHLSCVFGAVVASLFGGKECWLVLSGYDGCAPLPISLSSQLDKEASDGQN